MWREPLVMERCPCELWEGVACELPAGHKGLHRRAASPDGAALAWRSSSVPQRPAPVTRAAMFRLAVLTR